MCHLRSFKIYFDLDSPTMDNFDILSFFTGSLCISLTSPATLEHLELNIQLHLVSVDGVDHSFYEDLCDVWSHLDSIITHSTGSRLQRVDINFNYSFRFRSYDFDMELDRDALLKAVLDGLPLLHSKGILFFKAALMPVESWLR